MKAPGTSQYNPGWHLALDLRNMLLVSEAVTRAALERRESRGGHTREDYPGPDPEFGKINFVQRQTAAHGYLSPIDIAPEPLPEMPAELRALLEEAH